MNLAKNVLLVEEVESVVYQSVRDEVRDNIGNLVVVCEEG